MRRLPIIRHVRWAYHSWACRRWARMWGDAGIGLGHIAQSDLDQLDRIWRGEA